MKSNLQTMRAIRALLLLAILFALTTAVSPAARAADLTAVNEAELVTAIDTVNAAVDGDHTITLTADIVLTAPLPPIDNPNATSILLDGADFTLDAAGTGTALAVLSGTTATIQNLTITGGAGSSSSDGLSGGGIYNEGILTVIDSTITANSGHNGGGILNYAEQTLTTSLVLTRVTISDNDAIEFGGGIYSNGNGGTANLNITDSVLSGNDSINLGGGIANHGYGGNANVTIERTTITDNNGESGGGIFNNGNAGVATVTLQSVTLSDNDASDTGGGIFNNGNLGTATIALTNSTISNNSAVEQGGGIANIPNSGTSNTSLTFTTVAGNSAKRGAGVYNSANGTVNLAASILQSDSIGNTCDTVGDAIITSDGYNLDDDDSCNLTETGDIPGGNHALQPRALNAPGTTETHSIDVDSDAQRQIPTGTLGCGDIITSDQRGAPRPFPGTLCDIGAYESDAAEEEPPVCEPPYLPATEEALLAAIACVNDAGPGNHSITLAADITLAAASTPFDNPGATEILLEGDGFILDGGLSGTVITVETGTTVRVRDITITGGQGSSGPDSDWAGGAYNRGSLTIETSTFSGNTAARGGAIANHGEGALASLTVIRSTLSGNSATADGGGILNTASAEGSASLSVVNSTLSGNIANAGGGLFNEANGGDAGANFVFTTLAGNTATTGGGGIHTSAVSGSSSVTLTATILFNGPGGSPECARPSGVLTSIGYNLAGDDTCNLTQGNDLPSINPGLLPLALNAPGRTPTHALGSDSPAIDRVPGGAAGCGTAITTDQRGAARPQPAGGSCDVGAFEAPPTAEEPNVLFLPVLLR